MATRSVGIVLAGGASRRMQATADAARVRKEMLTLGGRTFLDMVVEAVAAELGDASRVIVVAAPGQPLPAVPGRVHVVRDSLPGSGPLAGIADGMRAAIAAAQAAGHEPPELAVIASCDVPLLRPRVVQLLIDKATSSRALWTVPLVGGHRQVLVSVVRLRFLEQIEAWLATGRRDPRGLLEQLEAADRLESGGQEAVKLVTEAECVAIDPALESFLDVDTPEDYERICRQLTYGKAR